jgi:hypothetical protein
MDTITESYIWAVSHGYINYMLTCDLGFHVTKDNEANEWYTKEEKKYYQSLILGNPIIRINYTGKTYGMTDATKLYTEIYKTKYKSIFVQIEGDEHTSGVFAISKKGFSINKFLKSAKYGHEREIHTLENHRDLVQQYLPEGV